MVGVPVATTCLEQLFLHPRQLQAVSIRAFAHRARLEQAGQVSHEDDSDIGLARAGDRILDLRGIPTDWRSALEAGGGIRIHVARKYRRLRVAFGEDLAAFGIAHIVGTKAFGQGLQRRFCVLDALLLHISDNQVNREAVAAEHCQLIICRRTNHRHFRFLCDIERQNSFVL